MITDRVKCALQVIAEIDHDFTVESGFSIFIRMNLLYNYPLLLTKEVVELLLKAGIVFTYFTTKLVIAKKLSQISLAEVIEAVEGKIEVDAALKQNWRLPYTIQEALTLVSVDDLAKSETIIEDHGLCEDGYSKFDIAKWEASIAADMHPKMNTQTYKMWKAVAMQIVKTEKERPARMARAKEIIGQLIPQMVEN